LKRGEDRLFAQFSSPLIEPIASPVGSANLSRNSTARRNFNGDEKRPRGTDLDSFAY
jgi:hypothetical protein